MIKSDILPVPMATDDVEQGKRNLDEFGVSIHKAFIAPETARWLKQRLEELATQAREGGKAAFAYGATAESDGRLLGTTTELHVGRPIGLPAFQLVSPLIDKEKSFNELTLHGAAMEYVRHVFGGRNFEITGQGGAIVRRSAPAQLIHADDFGIPSSNAEGIVVMVALDEFEEDMAATRVIPGSHRRQPPHPHIDPSTIETVPILMERGDAVIWENRLWHGQGASNSYRPRYTYGTYYAATAVKLVVGENLRARNYSAR